MDLKKKKTAEDLASSSSTASTSADMTGINPNYDQYQDKNKRKRNFQIHWKIT